MNKQLILSIILVVSLLAVLPASVSADQYVSPGDDIQAAVDAAMATGGTVYFAQGTYYVHLVIDTPTSSFTLKGAAAGNTFLDGGGTDTVIRIIGTGDCVVTVEEFTIQNGYATGWEDSNDNGGGMFNCRANPVVRNCAFVSNHANHNGGGMFNGDGSNPYVEGCAFMGNTAGTVFWNGVWDYDNNRGSSDGHGAGMANRGNSAPTVVYCLFSDNVASWSGGGMHTGGVDTGDKIAELDAGFPSEDAPTGVCGGAAPGAGKCADRLLAGETLDGGVLAVPTVIGCTFMNNTAGWSGGGMTNGGYSSSFIQGCHFIGNISMWNGGGMKNSNYSTTTIDGCFFSSNRTGWNGGGMKNGTGSAPTVTNCVFVGNEVVGLDYYRDGVIMSGGGGGMKNGDESAPIVTNCTFCGNKVTHTTYCGNYDGANGGGVKNGHMTQAVYTNCIIWGNTPNNVLDSTYDTEPDKNADTTITYSNVGGGYPGEGNIDADPLFVNAPTDVSLRAGSPCINAGTNTGTVQYGNVFDDILGVLRPQRSAYDMGAYECAGTSFSPVIIQPLARTQLQSILALWTDLSGRLPDEPSDEMSALIAQVQGHVANAAQLTNPIYASGQLSKAAAAMQQLAVLIA